MDREQSRVEMVSEERVGTRLDQFLADCLAVSRAQARRLLEQGAVTLDGRPATARDKGRSLAAGCEVTVAAFRLPADQQIVPQPSGDRDRPICGVLARGEGWLAVDKRPGFPVHPLEEFETATVLNCVAAMHPEVHGVGEGGLRSGVVHRLDVDTSGVLLVATASDAWDRLRRGFREHRVHKVYRAIVCGNLSETIEQEVGLVVAQHRPARVRVVDRPQGGESSGVWIAAQRVQPLEQFAGASLVEVRPQTGFLHQIRATLAELGHPVLGDRIYGGCREHPWVSRHQLHAAALRFDEIDVGSPDPDDFAQVLARLRP
ncbi:MAG: RluA family pseudouridine synthase [bacterium]|nr:RluA family pseudouridine synthase [bacterium]